MKIPYSKFKAIVIEEMKEMGMLPKVEDVEAVEVEPGKENVLVQPVDFVEVLKLKEAYYLKKLATVRSKLRETEKKK